MKTNRRAFISSAALAGSAATLFPVPSFGSQGDSQAGPPDYAALDEVLELPVLKRELFSSPVIS